MQYYKVIVGSGEVLIRDFDIQDIDAMIWFLRESDRQELLDFGVDLSTIPDASTLRKALKGRIESSRRDFLVIEEQGKMIGYISVPELRDGKGSVHAHIIYKDKRRQGIGRAVLPAALSILFKNLDAELFVLEPKTTNTGMNGLIQSFGLRPIRTHTTQASAFTGTIEVNRYEITRIQLQELLEKSPALPTTKEPHS